MSGGRRTFHAPLLTIPAVPFYGNPGLRRHDIPTSHERSVVAGLGGMGTTRITSILGHLNLQAINNHKDGQMLALGEQSFSTVYLSGRDFRPPFFVTAAHEDPSPGHVWRDNFCWGTQQRAGLNGAFWALALLD
ncbi:hypothetical protein EDD85DRAFT_956244 [Armillaria nabsnona]|nr:hypothetical protein EDD85DRAFT_956244 [Armillaria nabsnona]